MRQADPRSGLQQSAGAPVPARVPFAPKAEFGDLISAAFHNPFLDDFEEVIAGTKYKVSNVPHAVSNSVGRKYDVQRVGAEGAKSHE